MTLYISIIIASTTVISWLAIEKLLFPQLVKVYEIISKRKHEKEKETLNVNKELNEIKSENNNVYESQINFFVKQIDVLQKQLLKKTDELNEMNIELDNIRIELLKVKEELFKEKEKNNELLLKGCGNFDCKYRQKIK